jgi:hypothetical protein
MEDVYDSSYRDKKVVGVFVPRFRAPLQRRSVMLIWCQFPYEFIDIKGLEFEEFYNESEANSG